MKMEISSCTAALAIPSARAHRGRLFRHSSKDGALVALALLHGLALALFPWMLVIAAGMWWNANTISHNFIHLPFFRSRRLNRIFELYLTMLLGIPQTLWKQRHLCHHAESRPRCRLTGGAVGEILLLAVWWGVLYLSAPEFLWTTYLPGLLIGLSLCQLQGYYEHARGTTSHYGALYNWAFFNDGYHVEHHRRPTAHWSELPTRADVRARRSAWPPVLRWLEKARVWPGHPAWTSICRMLELLEHIALHCSGARRFLVESHRRAMQRLLPRDFVCETICVIGGGLFPRSAIILRELFPQARICLVDLNLRHLRIAQEVLGESVEYKHQVFQPGLEKFDLLVVPLSFRGERKALACQAQGGFLLWHDWIWTKGSATVVISWFLLKRLNLERLSEPRQLV